MSHNPREGFSATIFAYRLEGGRCARSLDLDRSDCKVAGLSPERPEFLRKPARQRSTVVAQLIVISTSWVRIGSRQVVPEYAEYARTRRSVRWLLENGLRNDLPGWRSSSRLAPAVGFGRSDSCVYRERMHAVSSDRKATLSLLSHYSATTLPLLGRNGLLEVLLEVDSMFLKVKGPSSQRGVCVLYTYYEGGFWITARQWRQRRSVWGCE
jgi:hypothetical protein